MQTATATAHADEPARRPPAAAWRGAAASSAPVTRLNRGGWLWRCARLPNEAVAEQARREQLPDLRASRTARKSAELMRRPRRDRDAVQRRAEHADDRQAPSRQ